MSVYCDEEIDLSLIESGECFPRHGRLSDSRVRSFIPDEAVYNLAGYCCEYLTDQLAFSLLSCQHRQVMVEKLRESVTGLSVKSGSSVFQQESFAEYFTSWSLIRFGAPASFISNVASSKSALSFYCKGCRQLIITQNEVESPHYHGGHGPAFLAHNVFNCHHAAEEAYETQFTTGVYKVCDVTCMQCGSRVGKKYIEARDPSNFFKVGKILLEQTLLTMPRCCNNRRLNAFPPEHYYCTRESGVSCFCSVCLEVVRSSTAATVLEMTRNLDPKLTVKLLSTLLTERHVLTREHSGEEEASGLISPASSTSSISRRFGECITKFVRKSSSSSSPTTPPSSPCQPNCATVGLLHEETPCTIRSKLSEEQTLVLSHSVGTRISMITECQNWIVSTKFVNELISAASRQAMLPCNPGTGGVQLSRVCVLESLVSQCGSVSLPSLTLLLSRLPNVEDRRAVVAGVSRNSQSAVSPQELDSLHCLAGGGSNGSSPTTRWTSFSAGNASFASFR